MSCRAAGRSAGRHDVPEPSLLGHVCGCILLTAR
jgi:hypothetical protein